MKSISDLFLEKGESGFREIERQALLEVSEFDDVLIATGGGTPCFFDNVEVMNQSGVSVYLKTDPAVLFGRLRIARQSRPILKSKTDGELLSFIESNLQKRAPYYEKASIIFDANELESSQQITHTSERLLQLLNDK
jgi:Shikimate kinase